MAIYSLGKIAQITGGMLAGEPEIMIRQLLTDSRTTSVSSSSLYIAITGARHNGHRFIDELYQRGVRGFVVSEFAHQPGRYPGAGFIVVRDTLSALQDLTAYHRMQYQCKVLAITGSNGKTIVKEWLHHCLSGHFIITRSPKSYNSQIGVPLSLWLIDKNTELALIEAGISLSGEMEKLQRMIKPETGIITNIGEAHQENFMSMEQKANEKLKLFYGCKSLVYCADSDLISGVIKETRELESTRMFTWSASGKGDINITNIIKGPQATRLSIHYGETNMDLTIPFDDTASIENAMHCIALMVLYEINKETIVARLSDLPPVAMRLEQKSGVNNCTLINDSYNSDLNSLAIALEVLNRQIQHNNKTLILSDIIQSGKKVPELYGMVAALVKEKDVTRIIGIGDKITESASLFTVPGKFYRSTEEFIEAFHPDDFRDEAILIKGSRRYTFERIAALLEQKKHTTRIEINLNALAHNLNHFRSLLKPGTKTMVMVKAYSYGSGRHEIAGILQFQRVDYLGVAIADEGVSLRNAGIKIPIMVMNPEPESFDSIIQHRLEPEMYGFGMMNLFQKAVKSNQETDYPVHLKLDTGMHRLGFLEKETDLLCHELEQYKGFRVVSVFSHLAGSDEKQFDEFTERQIAIFTKMSDRIIQALGYPVIRHILNTSGIERFPHAQFDMVRLGIGLYGISSVNQKNLRNVSTLKSTILQIKTVDPGETVGYSRSGKPAKSSSIAIVPVGYADGLNRKLGNGNGAFLVRGKLAPIMGNICMDMTMIDVTNTHAREGDEVVIFGEGYPITDMALKLNTIPYEILTGVSERVKRVYFQE